MIYMFTSGEYEQYGVGRHIEGPDDINIEPFLLQADSETKALWSAYAARERKEAPYCVYTDWPRSEALDRWQKWREENPIPPFTEDRLLELLKPLGFREVAVTEIYDYKLPAS